ncbi:unnamed protein product [Auanema sp. JU1783]|nr:unnamed protein product [Auanema sp. JU1783]
MLQVIDDAYEDSIPENFNTPLTQSISSRLFGGAESEPLIVTGARDSYNGSGRGNAQTLEPPQMDSSSNRFDERRWDHIEDLDQFFSRIYEYHQGGGFMCITSRKVLGILQFIFVVFFSTFFLQCIDYDVMFANVNITTTGQPISGKRHFSDVVVENCASHLHPLVILCLLLATIFCILRVVKAIYYILQMNEIRMFYESALGISDHQLLNLTWHSVLKQICAVQPRLHLTINKDVLDPVDVYNRILRFKNYFVSFVNQRIFPPVFDIPYVGKTAYLPNGLKYNIKRCLFLSSTSPWDGPCLKDDYKDSTFLDRLTTQMEKHVMWYGTINLVLFPFIFVYQILYSFCVVSEMIKKNPDSLGSRRYSNFGRYRLRHFNELNHELDARLNRSHNFANAYVNQFFSPLMKVIATHVRFMVGAIAFVLGGLTMWDEDVIQIEHVLTVIAVCGGIFIFCNSLIPDENLVWQPESLLSRVAAEIHYVPVEWKNNAHTDQVRHEFMELFQLKWMYLVHELLSPILTPFILMFWLKPRCREIIQFFHENTVSVQGLGDVCSFALLDVSRHGDPTWSGVHQSQRHDVHAYNGKTEMSVLHFMSTNPEWVPPPSTEQFIRTFKDRLTKEITEMNESRSNILRDSVSSLLPGIQNMSTLLGNGLTRVDGPVNQLWDSLNKNGGSLLDSMRRPEVESSVGGDLRVQTMFLRGMHEETRQVMAPSVYGASVYSVNNPSRSLFEVPQLREENEESTDTEIKSRLRVAPTVTYDEREEDEAEDHTDDQPPNSFMGV